MGDIGDEHFGSWFFYAGGSGIWFNTGNTISFTDHGDAFVYFQTKANNEVMAQTAAAAGFDSVQFLQHTDCEFKACNKKGGKLTYPNIEILSTRLVGHYACTSKTGTSDLIRTGWAADKPCVCDNGQNEDASGEC